MSQRRMFSPDIVESEEFITMPISSQALYFHLGMGADDDGFVQPKIIMRGLGANDDDLKVLLAKRFLLSFDGGVVVIKHWLIHNMIRGDRYKPTRFQDEKKLLKLKENKAYTEIDKSGCQFGNQPAPQVRLGKVRLGKDNKTSEQGSQINELIDLFKTVNPSFGKLFANKTQRGSAERLLKAHGFEKLSVLISLLPEMNKDKYAPVITTPLQLEDKFGQLLAYGQRKQANQPLMI